MVVHKCVLPCIFIGLLIVTASLFLFNLHWPKSNNVCTSKVCHDVASAILRNLNPTIDPCKNFAEFACGASINKRPIRVQCITNDFEERVMLSVEKQMGKTNVPKYYKLPQHLFEKCMQTVELKDGGDIRDYMKALNFLDLPFFQSESWNSKINWNWQSVMQTLYKWGYECNYIFGINFSIKTDGTLGIIINPGVWSQSPTTDQALFNLLNNYLAKTAKNKTLLHEDIKNALNFRAELRNLALQTSDDETTELTLEAINRLYPFLNLSSHINNLLPIEKQLNGNEVIILNSRAFFKELEILLNKTPNRTIVNFIACCVIEESIEYLPHYEYRLAKRMLGQHANDRRVKCVEHLKNSLYNLLMFLHAEEQPMAATRQAAFDMITELQSAYGRLINSALWLNSESKTKTKHDLHSFQYIIGYPEEVINKSLLALRYDNIAFDENYLNMQLQIKANDRYYQLTTWLNQQLTNERVYMSLVKNFESNALIVRNLKLPIVFVYAGLLDGKLRGIYLGAPNYINFSGLGSAISHEIMHYFDGCDKWLDDVKAKRFCERQSKCLINQFNDIRDEVTGLQVNGTLSRFEIFADNSGYAAAYEAYTNWQMKHVPEPLLPGLTNFTQNQLFWLFSAQLDCQQLDESTRTAALLKQSHPLPLLRITGAYRNNRNFARDFNCKPNDTMNPIDKCELWPEAKTKLHGS